ncbi:MAG: imidazole glycerol phosphate synthase subunit HisH [Rhodospirillales bacterium]|nr:imidazole glycerol phosphate synthase subunit HisH [Rhodospirillales bacterium]
MIGIIDYGMGNLRSVQKALERLGHATAIAATPGKMPQVDKLILPGVGAFADGMEHLRRRSWIKPIRDHVEAGRAFLGICLGMQLLFESSEEDAPSPDEPVPGLGLVRGRVVRFHEDQGPNRPRLKVPHMGWNALAISGNGDGRSAALFAGIEPGSHVYFVHGYYCRPDDEAVVVATTDYGDAICAAIAKGPLCAMQFHPEKSQKVGLQLLANFAGDGA